LPNEAFLDYFDHSNQKPIQFSNETVNKISNILGKNVSGYDGQNDIKEKSFLV
jgi:hypothetical protein